MKMATSKKILHIASIYNYVTGGFLLLIGILGVAGVGAALDTSEALEDVGLSFGLLAKGSCKRPEKGYAGLVFFNRDDRDTGGIYDLQHLGYRRSTL